MSGLIYTEDWADAQPVWGWEAQGLQVKSLGHGLMC